MIGFSDFILSKEPWAYCRLDEPVGYNVYHDISGNGNHIYQKDESNQYIKIADNQQNNTFTGDPFISGIKPLIENQTLSRDIVSWSIPDSALSFKIPTFKSDTIGYRKRQVIQNNLSINTLWIDFLMSTKINSYETILKDWLPLALSYNGSILKIDNLYEIGEFEYINSPVGNILSAYLSQKLIL